MKKTFSVMLAALLLTAIVGGCSNVSKTPAADTAAAAAKSTTAATASPAQATTANPVTSEYDEIEINYACINPKGHVIVDNLNNFKKLVEAKSGGKVTVKIFDSGVLGGQAELCESVNNGTLHMAYGTTSLFASYVPEISALGLPFLYKDAQHAQRAVTGEAGDRLSKMVLEKTNMQILTLMAAGFRDMLTNGKPIQSIADFKGVKFRSPEAFAWLKMFEALKATPTPLPYTEAYQALKTHLVDGVEIECSTMVSEKWYEIGTHVIITQHINTIQAPIINKKFFQSLKPATQELIQTCMDESMLWEFDQRLILAEQAEQTLIDKGMKIIKIDRAPIIEACGAVWDEFLKNYPSAKDVLEIIKNA